MSRSYKHTPVYKGDKDRFAKKLANRRIRRRSKLNPNDGQSGKSNHLSLIHICWRDNKKMIELSNMPRPSQLYRQ